MLSIDKNYAASHILPREKDSHKGDFGRVLIAAGSFGMAGAAVLAGRAALRSGSGLVQFLQSADDNRIYPILQTCVPEATCVFRENGIDYNKYDAIAVGPGLGTGTFAREALKDILISYGVPADTTEFEGCLTADTSMVGGGPSKTADFDVKTAAHSTLSGRQGHLQRKTLILDADALNIVASDEAMAQLVRCCLADIIITPHVGEARKLLASCTPENEVSPEIIHGESEVDKNAAYSDAIQTDEERIAAHRKLATGYNCVAVLKGAGTLTGNASDVMINTTGNPGMATAGSGDVLTGIITALAGQGHCAAEAAALGVYIHGLAGDLAAAEIGETSLLSSDIVDYLPKAFRSITGK